MTPELRETVLALADDEMLMGHHHSHWICVAPFLEEDLAFCSIGQDELGHAATLYELLVDEAEVDRFALRRPPGDYRSAWLCEADLPDWSDTVVRHWLYDTAEQVRWKALAEATTAGSPRWRGRLCGRRPTTAGMPPAPWSGCSAGPRRRGPRSWPAWNGWPRSPAACSRATPPAGRAFVAEAGADLAGTGVSWTWPAEPPTGQGRAGVRSADFAAVQARLNVVFDIDPDATW